MDLSKSNQSTRRFLTFTLKHSAFVARVYISSFMHKLLTTLLPVTEVSSGKAIRVEVVFLSAVKSLFFASKGWVC